MYGCFNGSNLHRSLLRRGVGVIVEDDFKCLGVAWRCSRGSLALQTSYDAEEEEIEDNEVTQMPDIVCIPCSRTQSRVVIAIVCCPRPRSRVARINPLDNRCVTRMLSRNVSDNE